jgi:hypothetical protein
MANLEMARPKNPSVMRSSSRWDLVVLNRDIFVQRTEFARKIACFFCQEMMILGYHFKPINYSLMKIERLSHIFQILKNVRLPRKAELCEYSFVKTVPQNSLLYGATHNACVSQGLTINI